MRSRTHPELPQYQEPEPAGHCSVCTTLPRLDHPLLLVRPQTGIGGVQNLHLVDTGFGLIQVMRLHVRTKIGIVEGDDNSAPTPNNIGHVVDRKLC